MANGYWHGTSEEWARVEAPLHLLDPALEDFARQHGLAVTRNAKDWPDRAIAWGAPVRCLIQVFLADAAAATYTLWISASQHRAGDRYWRHETLRKQIAAAALAPDLPALLEAGKRKLDAWSADPATLAPAPKPEKA